MSKKTEPLRKIDAARAIPGGGEVLDSTASPLPPAMPMPPAPDSLEVVSNTIGRSSAAPIALLAIRWRPPLGTAAPSYLVEVATDSGFTAVVLRLPAAQASATLELTAATTYYIRVYAIIAGVRSSASAALSVTTATDTTPAGDPTSTAAAFIAAGDLVVTWTNPTSENLRDVEVRVWNSSGKTTLYATGYSATGRLVWTAAENRAAGSGTPDPVVYVELRSRTWAGVLGNSVVVGTITKSAPGTPAGLAADFTGPDCIITWTAATDALYYRLSIDTVAQPNIYGGRYVYPFDANRVQHAGTPDPVLSLSLVAVDALDQTSAAATATATNAAPAAPASVTLATGFSAFMVSVSATEPADFATYRYRLIQTLPTAADVTWDSPAPLQTREVSAQATYQVGVKVMDVFGQLSTETLSSAAALDALTLADLRADVAYRDSLGTAAATLAAALKDGDAAGSGIAYAV